MASEPTCFSNMRPAGAGDGGLHSKVEYRAEAFAARRSPHLMAGPTIGGAAGPFPKGDDSITKPQLPSADTTTNSRGGDIDAGNVSDVDPDDAGTDDETPMNSKKKRKLESVVSLSVEDSGGASCCSGRSDLDDDASGSTDKPKLTFPWKLHTLLDDVKADKKEGIVSWDEGGKSFTVHKPKEFCEEIMVKYFQQSKLTSFTRQVCVDVSCVCV
jgi:hypothetical protein